MASLYFADQRSKQSQQSQQSQQQSEEDSSQKLQEEEEEEEAKEETPSPDFPPPSDPMSIASSAVGGMSYVGNDGIVKQLDPDPDPKGKEESMLYAQVGKEKEEERVLDAKVEAISPTTNMEGDEGFSQMSGLTDLASTRYIDMSNNTITKSKSPNHPQPDEEQPNSIKKSCPWMILFTCCLILAGGIGGGIAGALKKQEKDAVPTPAPIVIFNPTEGKTSKPSAPPPLAPMTLAPVIPSPPSMTDPQPLNDQCADAATFSLLTTSGSTGTATAHPELSDLNCGVDALDGAGIWYQVTGTGFGLTASTCNEETNFDTKLSIFTGSCDSLQCVATNDDQVGSDCGVLSTVGWISEAGATYSILVLGSQGEKGDFQLSLEFEPLVNDECDGATMLLPDGEFVAGSTVPANLDFVGMCDGIDTTAPGVWYKVVGTGEEFIISTCHQTDFDTKLSVFRGSCGLLQCVGSNDDYCDTQSRVYLDSDPGETYFILVHGYQAGTGQFNLNVATPENLYNDLCDDAQMVALNTLVSGDNLFAASDFAEVTTCDATVSITGPTVWYTVLGTGGDLMASSCDIQTAFDTQISVFSGPCSSLICVGGNDDSVKQECGLTSEFTWKTEPFEIYRIAVHGLDNATGSFGFSIEDMGGAPTYDTCETAAGPAYLTEVGVVLELSLFSSAVIDLGALRCDTFADTTTPSINAGVWLYLVGDGGDITASVCDNDNPDGMSLRIFSSGGAGAVGGCESLTCINGANECRNTFLSTANEIYYLFIQGPTGGSYALSLTTTGAPAAENDLCTGAIPLEIDSAEGAIMGTTIGASVYDGIGFCGEQITAPSVWYTVVGTGSDTAVGLCIGTEYDTKISVFEGSPGDDCDTTLVCVGGNDDFCDLQSAYGWFAEVGVTYYVLVHGFEDRTGTFEILAITQ